MLLKGPSIFKILQGGLFKKFWKTLNQVSIKFEKCLKKVFTVVYLEEHNKTAKMF